MQATRKKILFFIFGVSLLIAILNFVAATFFLYWSYWWFDIPMHFLGGFFAGLTTLWLYFFVGFHKQPFVSSLQVMLVALLGAISIGTLWEIFEYFSGVTLDVIGNYTLDTVKDLTLDITGGYFSYFYFVVKGYHKNIY